MTTQSLAPSLSDFSDSDLPAAIDDPTQESYPEVDASPATEASEDKRPNEAGTCPTCGEPIYREPGARGRAPKYHPDCRPSKGKPVVSIAPGTRTSKAEKEADAAVAAFRSLVVKSCLLLAGFEKYDAFAIMASLPQLCENLRGVLVRYDKVRAEFLNIGQGGSILGLVVTVAMLSLSISAHHGLIPKKYGEVLIRAPFVLHKIQQRLEEGEASLTSMMADMMNRPAPSKAGTDAE